MAHTVENDHGDVYASAESAELAYEAARRAADRRRVSVWLRAPGADEAERVHRTCEHGSRAGGWDHARRRWLADGQCRRESTGEDYSTGHAFCDEHAQGDWRAHE